MNQINPLEIKCGYRTLRKLSISREDTLDRSDESEAGGGNPSGLAGSLPVVK